MVPEVNKVEAELQRKALESVTKTVKNLEKKFQALEAKIKQVKSEQIAVENERKEAVKISEQLQQSPQSAQSQSQPSLSPDYLIPVMLKVVKHLSTSPIGSGFLKSSDFPPENAYRPPSNSLAIVENSLSSSPKTFKSFPLKSP